MLNYVASIFARGDVKNEGSSLIYMNIKRRCDRDSRFRQIVKGIDQAQDLKKYVTHGEMIVR